MSTARKQMNFPSDLPPVLKLNDVAKRLGRCHKTIRNRLKSGAIRSYKENNAYRIRREWLLEYEESLIVQPDS